MDGVGFRANAREWQQNGFVIFPKLFSDYELKLLRDDFGQIVSGTYNSGRSPIVDPYRRRDDLTATQIVDNPHWACHGIRNLIEDERIAGNAAQLLGVSAVRIWATQLLEKPATSGKSGHVGWHQDYDYWECASPPNLITAWLPLDDANESNGTLAFAPGSHERGHIRLRGFLDIDLEAQTQLIRARQGTFSEARLAMRAGQISFHHCLTLHCSGANKSASSRRAISVHMMPEGTFYVAGTSCDSHPNVMLLGKAAGSLFTGTHFPLIYRR